MADEKKAVDTSKASKAEKKEKKESRFSPKKIGKAIARFFKDLRGETKKIVWPGRKMIIKSTGVVLAAILVIGAGIWVIDFAVAKSVTAISEAASKTEETTEASGETAEDKDVAEEATEKATEKSAETTEATTKD